MQLIKKGTFMMGTHNPNRMFPGRDVARQVTVESFYMDETEITNDQYRQFVLWVRDSIAYRELIAAGRTEYEIDDPDSDSIRIRWSQRIRWNDRNEDVQEALSTLYYQGNDNLGVAQLNAARIIYRYRIFNYDQAALPRNQFNYRTNSYSEDAYVEVDTAFFNEQGHIINQTIRRKLTSRNDFYSTKIVNVYPDTLTWVNDLRFSFNDPKMKMYFSNPQYADYPVVGVSWEQAQAFCHWRTMMYNTTHKVQGEPFRLPTEAEWEFAAKGRDRNATFPWKGNSLIDEKKNCYLANFKQDRGNYVTDAGVTTKAVKSYKTVVNANGLFDMAGNVAEWTSTAYFGTSGAVTADINPSFEYNAKAGDPATMKRKVVKGGSWKDIPYYLQSGSRTYEYQYESRPYIGFRCVRSYKGDVK
jgi:gliding motility-associated lipoprotein GldK